MYTSAIDYHIYTIILLVICIVLFYLFTLLQRDFTRYKISIRNWMPIYVFALASATFTGIVMMAAKQLMFTLPNLLMIGSSLVLLALEILRHKRLKASPLADEKFYIAYAKRIYAIELITLFVTVYITKLAMMP